MSKSTKNQGRRKSPKAKSPGRRQSRNSRYRSGLEVRNAKHLKENGVSFEYETLKIKWEDNRTRTYTPDFILPNGIIVETKGRFLSDDRRKHLEVKRQRPELDIRFVFSNPYSKLYKGSQTTYAQWCEKNGFLYASGDIPIEWTQENNGD